jgi:hypothetical protein
MRNHPPPPPPCTWSDSGHASLCALGAYRRDSDFFPPLEERVQLKQKVLTDRPVQKLQLVLVGLLAGAKAVSHPGTTLRVAPALQRAFGLPGCAEPSVLADTLNAATDRDGAAVRAAVEAIFHRHSPARQHDCTQAMLILDLDRSPLPTRARAAGAARACMGRSRSRTGRQLVRVRAAPDQDTVWEAGRPGHTAEGRPVRQDAITQAERLLALAGDDEAAQAKRARTEVRLDSRWGSTAALTWLLARGYQVMTTCKATSRVRKLVRSAAEHAWHATTSAGRAVAVVRAPVDLAKPTQQYAVRTPAPEKPGGDHYAVSAVLVTRRVALPMPAAVTRYDARGGMAADLTADKHGVGLATLRKRQLAAPEVLVLLVQLAHTVLIWARIWLTTAAPRLGELGMVRLVREVWAVPGRVKLVGPQGRRVRWRAEHPRVRDGCCGLRSLLHSQIPVDWG